MVSLQKIANQHADAVLKHTALSRTDVAKMIEDSDAKHFDGRYFEMYAVMSGKSVVGLISLFERSASAVSIGPEIFAEYRKRGYAAEAMQAAMDLAKSRGYRVVLQQVRIDNAASIGLHTKLGFETDHAVFQNRKQHDVCFYLKTI